MLTDTWTPADISAFGWKGFIASGVLAQGQNLAKGTVVGVITATNKLTAYNSANVDGSQVAVGILMDSVNLTSANGGVNQDWPVRVCYAFGLFPKLALTGIDDNAIANLGGKTLNLGGVDYVAFSGGTYAFTQLTIGTGGLRMAQTAGPDTDYTIPSTANVVVAPTLTAARAYTLPSAANYGVGRILIIKGPSNANTYSLTITRAGSDTIDGANTKVISTAYGPVMLQAQAGGWAVLSNS